MFRRTKVLWYELSISLAFVLQRVDSTCFPAADICLSQLGVCPFITILKQGMDFQIQRDHYREVYRLPL